MKENYTAIDTTLFRANQSWYYTEVRKYNDWEFMRVEIIRNAYDHQSCVRLDKWMPNGWQTFITHPIEDTPASAISYVQEEPNVSLFSKTCETMWGLYSKAMTS